MVKRGSNGEGRYGFVKASDHGREIEMATMLFDVPDPSTT
jgi:hypothetical protein